MPNHSRARGLSSTLRGSSRSPLPGCARPCRRGRARASARRGSGRSRERRVPASRMRGEHRLRPRQLVVGAHGAAHEGRGPRNASLERAVPGRLHPTSRASTAPGWASRNVAKWPGPSVLENRNTATGFTVVGDAFINNHFGSVGGPWFGRCGRDRRQRRSASSRAPRGDRGRIAAPAHAARRPETVEGVKLILPRSSKAAVLEIDGKRPALEMGRIIETAAAVQRGAACHARPGRARPVLSPTGRSTGTTSASWWTRAQP